MIRVEMIVTCNICHYEIARIILAPGTHFEEAVNNLICGNCHSRVNVPRGEMCK